MAAHFHTLRFFHRFHAHRYNDYGFEQPVHLLILHSAHPLGMEKTMKTIRFAILLSIIVCWSFSLAVFLKGDPTFSTDVDLLILIVNAIVSVVFFRILTWYKL